MFFHNFKPLFEDGKNTANLYMMYNDGSSCTWHALKPLRRSWHTGRWRHTEFECSFNCTRYCLGRHQVIVDIKHVNLIEYDSQHHCQCEGRVRKDDNNMELTLSKVVSSVSGYETCWQFSNYDVHWCTSGSRGDISSNNFACDLL